MTNSSTIDYSSRELRERVRRAASKAAAQSGLYREVDDIEQEVWLSLLALDHDLSPEKIEAACSSIALYRRAIDYTRTRDPLSRAWRMEMASADISPSTSASQIMHEAGNAARMRRQAEMRPVDSQEMDLVESNDSDIADQVVLRDAISGAVQEIIESKISELDRAILHEYLINKTTVLAKLADRYGVTESAVSLRVTKLRKRLQVALARRGVTANDVR
jgi:RNA polymerase sigma factor (sigma-70 family)